MTQGPAKDWGVNPLHPRLVDKSHLILAGALRQVARPQQVGAQHRNRRQGHNQRSREGEHHGERKGQEEGSHQPLDEPQGNEYHDGGQGGGKDGRSHLGGGIQRRPPSFSSGLDVAVHIFQYHDGVVYDATHRYGQASEGHEIEGHILPGHQQDPGEYAKRYRQCDDDGRTQGGDQPAKRCRPDGEHECEDDRHRKEETEQGLLQKRIDLVLYLRPLVGNKHHVEPGRDVPQAFNSVSDSLGDLNGVGLGILDDGHVDGRFSVGAGDAGRRTVGKLHAGHIAKPHRPRRRGAHNQVAYLLHRTQSVNGLDGHRTSRTKDQSGG